MKRTNHNLSNYKLATLDMGKLVPVQYQEVLPGDSMQLETSAVVRVSPLMAPIMHQVTVRFHHYFVPNRILWDKWEDFITGGEDGANADVIPQHTLGATPEKGVLDYMGVPPVPNLQVNELPLRAYNMIYNEIYRDEDLQTKRLEDDNTLASVNWRQDVFTTARPFSQKGNTSTLPIGTFAPIKTDQLGGAGQSISILNSNDDIKKIYAGTTYSEISTTAGTAGQQLYADLTSATGVTATEFREFFAMQRYAEARARHGGSYVDYLRMHGIKPSDGRLSRPEYLGGGKANLQFSEVLQTAEGVDPVGEMKGHGITSLKTRKTKRYFEEHGSVITLMSVVPRSIYTDGAQRSFFRTDKEDFFTRELQHIGQQEVLQGELYCSDTADVRNTFGYANRYSEYTETPSTVAGEFRDSTMNHWHMARDFTTAPILNDSFLKCVPTKRIHAVETNDVLWCMINNKTFAKRMVEKNPIARLK